MPAGGISSSSVSVSIPPTTAATAATGTLDWQVEATLSGLEPALQPFCGPQWQLPQSEHHFSGAYTEANPWSSMFRFDCLGPTGETCDPILTPPPIESAWRASPNWCCWQRWRRTRRRFRSFCAY